MNRQEIRNKAKRKRAKEVARKKFLISVIVSVIFVVSGCIIVGNNLASSHVNAKTVNMEKKLYKSIVIESGDTLWSLAEEYGSEYVDKQEYIKTLMEVNNLSTDLIHQGQHLVVIYYE